MGELPVFKKCCYCVPLRYGLLSWGYLKLVSVLTVLSYFIFVVVVLSRFILRDVSLMLITGLIASILAIEIVLHVIFIIGAHKKKLKLIKVYYYYALFMWVAIIVTSLVGTAFLIDTPYDNHSAIFFLMDGLGSFFAIVVQTFLVLSIRSEIIKLRSNCPYRFVKNENNPEGTINSVSVKDDEEMYIDNGTVQIM